MTPGFLPTLEEQALLPTFDLQLKGGGGVCSFSAVPQSVFLGSLQGKADVEEEEEEERLGE